MSEIKNETPKQERVFRRGEIYYIHEFPVTGSEQRPGRPAVIVSNDECNRYSPVLEVVYLTLQKKSSLPTHVYINSGPCACSTILCEQITSVSVDKIGDFKCDLPENLLEPLNDALRISLSIKETSPDFSRLSQEALYALTPTPVMDELNAMKAEVYTLQEKLRLAEDANSTLKRTPSALAKQLKDAEQEAGMYKRMYDELLDKLIRRC